MLKFFFFFLVFAFWSSIWVIFYLFQKKKKKIPLVVFLVFLNLEVFPLLCKLHIRKMLLCDSDRVEGYNLVLIECYLYFFFGFWLPAMTMIFKIHFSIMNFA